MAGRLTLNGARRNATPQPQLPPSGGGGARPSSGSGDLLEEAEVKVEAEEALALLRQVREQLVHEALSSLLCSPHPVQGQVWNDLRDSFACDTWHRS